MFHILIDTSVWLDLAEPKQASLLDPLIAMLSGGYANILVPRTVLTEFQANRARIAKSSEKSLSTHSGLVKDAIRRSEGDKKQKSKVLAYLSDVDHAIPLIGGAAKTNLDRIAEILSAATPIEISDAVKVRAADRALTRKAPCHLNKNSVADAVLIETSSLYGTANRVIDSRSSHTTTSTLVRSMGTGSCHTPKSPQGSARSNRCTSSP